MFRDDQIKILGIIVQDAVKKATELNEIIYRDNLAGLVITPQINNLMHGNGLLANNYAVSNNNQDDNSVGGGLTSLFLWLMLKLPHKCGWCASSL